MQDPNRAGENNIFGGERVLKVKMLSKIREKIYCEKEKKTSY